MNYTNIILCLVAALAIPCGQLLFKLAAVAASPTASFLEKVFGSPYLVLALAAYGLGALVWYYILLRVPLSAAYPFLLFGSAAVPVGAWLFFGEPLTGRYVFGYFLMMIGFYVTVSGT